MLFFTNLGGGRVRSYILPCKCRVTCGAGRWVFKQPPEIFGLICRLVQMCATLPVFVVTSERPCFPLFGLYLLNQINNRSSVY